MSDNAAISVKNLKKDFVLPHQKASSLKSFLISPFKRYDIEKQKALKGVSFEVEKGDFFGIVGRNGSGKSTLLKCLAGVYHSDSGEININGSLVPFIELGVGFKPELSGRDNVFLNGALLGFSRSEITEMYDEIVEFSELERFMDQKLKNFSSGMQVRLAFSIAIQAQGDILLLDEVLAVGDAAFQKKCFNYFEQLKENKNTVILVTHDMNAVKRFCTKAILLEEGNITHSGAPADIASQYAVINITKDNQSKKIAKEAIVDVKVVQQSDEKIKFSMKHNNNTDEDYYFGFSLIKDGSTIAELNSLETGEATKSPGKIVKKTLSYELDIKNLNPGTYELSATLFKVKTREPVAYTVKRPEFIIQDKTNDLSRGGALRLEKNWADN